VNFEANHQPIIKFLNLTYLLDPPPRFGFGSGGFFRDFARQGFNNNNIQFAAGVGPFGLFPMMGVQFVSLNVYFSTSFRRLPNIPH
jgi:hypothetical protein